MNKPSAAKRPPLVAIIGNPNTGKTTLFNSLTGLRQRTANYPGVTVAGKSGHVALPDGGSAELLDLPGLYSLAAVSLDERVVIDALCGRLPDTPVPDAILCVADATNPLRTLFLASQAAELGIPMLLVFNQADLTRKHGVAIDTEKISARLGGIPIVAASAWRREGLREVCAAIATTLEKKLRMPRLEWDASVTAALAILREGLERCEGATAAAPLADAELQRLLFDTDSSELDRIRGIYPAAVLSRLTAAARERVRHGGLNPFSVEAVLHYARMKTVLDGTFTESPTVRALTQRLDRYLMSRVVGPFIFLGAMAVLFTSVFWLASFPQTWLEEFFKWLAKTVTPLLEGTPILQSLVTDGVIAGVGAFLGFLPQILMLFFFVALLEESGYMARAAFLMDKLFAWCGLNGKSFVPMLSGYACGVPSILATRTIEDPKARLATIFIVPLMSCSARLPVYSLVIGAFLVPKIGALYGGLVMVGMYLVGLAIALPTAWVLTRFVLKTRPQPFVLEMPRYQRPNFRDVFMRLWDSGAEFVQRAGTIIFAITVIVWALLYFPHSEETAAAAKSEFVAGKDGVEAALEKAEKQKDAYESAVAEFTAAANEAGKSVDDEALKAWLVAKNLDPEAAELASGLENHIAAAHVEHSYMGRFGKWVQPVFAPAGFDWKITVGVLASFPAREVIIATLGTTYSLGGEADAESNDLREAMAKATWTEGALAGKPIFTISVAVGIMLFFALCSQCGATLAVITKEAGWRWALASFVYMTALAWLAAVASYQIGGLFG